MRKQLLVLFVALAATGCYTTTMRSGKPVGEAPLAADDRWHSGFLGGTQEASGPYDLSQLCPDGWAEIRTKTSFGNGLVELLTVGVYNPQTVDVKCAAKTQAKREVHASAQ
jgi:hypothetical protein